MRVSPVGICYKTPQNTRLSANRVWGKWLNCNNFTFVNCSNVRESWEICTLNIISTFVKCSNDTFYWNLRWWEKVMNNYLCKSYTWWYKHSNIMSTLPMLGVSEVFFISFLQKKRNLNEWNHSSHFLRVQRPHMKQTN